MGIDESGIGGDSSRQILVGAFSSDERLVYSHKGRLLKARDYIALREAGSSIEPPSYEVMLNEGLETFFWGKNRSGSLPSQIAAHATITELIIHCGRDTCLSRLVVYVDRFHSDTKEILGEYLERRGYARTKGPIIHVIRGSDKDQKLVNFADIIAFQIGELCRRKQDTYPRKVTFPIEIDPQFPTLGQRVILPDGAKRELELLLAA